MIRGALRKIKIAAVMRSEAKFRSRLLASAGPVSGQLFILGLPRSGTTLIYQYIVHRCRVSYFTTGVGEHPYEPCRTTSREIAANPPYRSDFVSDYGRTSGPAAPREAGSFWLRFFDIDAYELFADVARGSVDELRETIQCMQLVFGGAPFVNKNVKHILRVDALANIFPSCHFLVVERNRRDVWLSVLRGRKNMYGDFETWFSARPDNYESLVGLPPERQVHGQLTRLQERLGNDLGSIDQSRVHTINYDDFCSRPDSVIELLSPVLGDTEKANDAVESFVIKHSHPETDMEERLCELADGSA